MQLTRFGQSLLKPRKPSLFPFEFLLWLVYSFPWYFFTSRFIIIHACKENNFRLYGKSTYTTKKTTIENEMDNWKKAICNQFPRSEKPLDFLLWLFYSFLWHFFTLIFVKIPCFVSNFCRNDDFSSTMSWVPIYHNGFSHNCHRQTQLIIAAENKYKLGTWTETVLPFLQIKMKTIPCSWFVQNM